MSDLIPRQAIAASNGYTPLPDDILHGVPIPNRGRWQPLRCGIIGLFHYDAQQFIFYKGRLLIRGNNGNGKSMALEVTLPYLFDADMASEKLSTFGTRGNRTMYTWLLGHDEAERHATARGYVWAEFGRLGPLGTAEYFTVGAGLEAIRVGEKVTAWYFTTAARVGVDLHLGAPNTVAIDEKALTVRLAELTESGRTGAIRTAGMHTAEVNRVLYGVSSHSFTSLLKALRQLRRPKLSDKLSQQRLADILTDSLAPLRESLVTSIAQGYERLDRHHDDIDHHRSVITNLRSVEAAYQRYARAELWLRAKSVGDMVAAIDRAEKKATASAAERDRLDVLQNKIDKDIADGESNTAALGAELAGLKDRAAYTQGQELLTTKLQAVEALEGVASTQLAAVTAATEAARESTTEHEQATAALSESTAVVAKCSLDARLTAGSFGLLQRDHDTLMSTLDTASTDRGSGDIMGLRSTARTSAADLTARISGIIRLHETARSARGEADARERDVSQAQRDVAAKDSALGTARSQRDAELTALAEAALRWQRDSDQLTASGDLLDTTSSDLPAELVRWRHAASTRRLEALGELERAISHTRTVHAETVLQRAETASSLDEALQAVNAVDEATALLGAAEQRWLADLHDWYTGLRELPRDVAAPSLDIVDHDSWLRWRDDGARRRTAEIDRGTSELATLTARIGERRNRSQEAHDALVDEFSALEAERHVGPPQPPARKADRTNRPGAPLFELIDFADDLDSAAFASLEAALFASGLLDAWVHPTGQVEQADGGPLLDTQITPAARVTNGPSLLTAIRVDEQASTNAQVPTQIVNAILDSIELAESASAGHTNTLTIGLDGTWRFGSLHGAHEQTSARFVGAAARHRAREERLAELTAAIEKSNQVLTQLQNEYERLSDQAQNLEIARTALHTEIAGLPGDDTTRHQASVLDAATWQASRTSEQLNRRHATLISGLNALHQAAKSTYASFATDGLTDIELPDEPPEDVNTTDHEEVLGLLDRCRAVLNAWASALDSSNAYLTKCRAHTRLQADACPPADAATRAIQRYDEAATARATAETTRVTVQAKYEAAAKHSDQAAAILDGALAEAVLTDWKEQLPKLAVIITKWHDHIEDLLSATDTARFAHDRATRAATRYDIDHDRIRKAQAAADEASAKATAARLRYNTLVAHLGPAFHDLSAQVTAIEERIRIAEEGLKSLQSQKVDNAGRLGSARTTAETDDRAHATLQTQLPEKINNLRVAHALGLTHMSLWLPAETVADDADDATIIELARHLLTTGTRSAAEDAEQAANEVYNARHTADSALSGTLSLIERRTEEILVIEAVHATRTKPLAAVIADINTELVAAQVLLTREESELLEQFLTDDIRREVSDHITRARRQIATMNDLMGKHRTSNGYRFSLKWSPNPKANFNDAIIDLLAADFDTAPSAKDRLREFFRGKVNEIRANKTGRTWQEQLLFMLEYRSWYTFRIFVQKDSGPMTELDNTNFNNLSGGEKSVALHLPLFAAAETHTVASAVRDTTDPTRSGCPRLILLDEVFAGVDEDMRGELFDLISTLDMDLIATSESETGLYAELDGIAIYHVVTYDGMPGALAIRSVWDGIDEHDLLDHDLEFSA